MKSAERLISIFSIFLLLAACEKEDGSGSSSLLSTVAHTGVPGKAFSLDSRYVITEVVFSPIDGMADKMVLGVFEGANESDFSDAVPIHVLKEAPSYGENHIQINCTKGFRYLRYYGPSGSRTSIRDLSFSGYKSKGKEAAMYQLTNLPLVVIHTADNESIDSRSRYVNGRISVISDGGKTYYTDGLAIKGRGNASWGFPKKPYSIKLDHKTCLAGLSSDADDWVLLSSYGDNTLMRNLVCFDVGRMLDMEFTPEGRLVDFMLNGDYKGTYILCDKVEVHEQRVNVEKIKPTDTDSDVITGGYLLDVDAYGDSGRGYFWSSRGAHIRVRDPDPDYITEEQQNYINAFYNNLEARVFEDNFQSILDVDSFLRYFLQGEFTGNTDTFYCVKMYKRRGEPRMYVGPGWDFDLALDNDWRTTPINDLDEYLALSSRSSTASTMRSFARHVVNASGDMMRNIWKAARSQGGLTENNLMTIINRYAAEMLESQELNFKRWPVLSEKTHEQFQALGSFDAEVDYMKGFVRERIKWMDRKLGN